MSYFARCSDATKANKFASTLPGIIPNDDGVLTVVEGSNAPSGPGSRGGYRCVLLLCASNLMIVDVDVLMYLLLDEIAFLSLRVLRRCLLDAGLR